MKSLREILLDRHRSAGPKLDAIRQTALAAAFPAEAGNATSPVQIARPLPLRIAFLLWRELILPSRRIWAGLAAVWLVILCVNLSGSGKSVKLAGNSPPPDRQVLAELREQKEMLAQFMEPFVPSPAIRPKTTAPRSEIFQTITLV